jgi:beta-galactosidase
MLESWTWPTLVGKELTVEIFSRCEKVQLFLNGKLLGEKPTTRAEQFKANFPVPYAPGELKAVGLINGQKAAESTLRTAGPTSQLRLTVDRSTLTADAQDLAYITVEAVDKDGQIQPTANNTVKFTLTGPATLAGVDNGDLSYEKLYHADQMRLFNGRALVVLRSTRIPGIIKLLAASKDLPNGSTQLESLSPHEPQKTIH